MMRFLRFAFVAAAGVTLSSCFESTTLVKLNGDGSGTIEQRTAVTGSALAMVRQFASMGANKSQGADPFSEAEARKFAEKFGPDVTYVSSSPIKTDKMEGRTAVYAFTDISKIHLTDQPITPGSATIGNAKPASNPQVLTFTLAPQGADRLLTIGFPEPKVPGGSGDGAPKPATLPTDPAALQQIAMFKQMLAGAHFNISVQPAGRLVKTNSPYVEGGRVTLLDVDFDQLVKDDAAIAKLQALQGVQSIDEARTKLKDVPGLKFPMEKTITIEFAPK